MKTLQNFDTLQKFERLSIRAIGQAFGIGLVVVLLLLWALTEPFFQLGQQIEHRRKLKTKNK